ncbi:MAG: histidine kinase, partial [Candidatus Kapabacteria bacterium]|nr:histidine kinase [Candidatus Kapabacteria bacterium]
MRNLILLSALFFVMIYVSNAQLSGQARIDSLEAELPKAKQDTNHVNLLANLSFEYYSIDPNSGIKFGDQGVKLAKKLAWKEGEARCYSSLGNNNIGKSNYPKALEYLHKSLKINE